MKLKGYLSVGLTLGALALLACSYALADVAAPAKPPLGDARDRQAAKRKLDFNRDVCPILSDNCFFCHGPDINRREGVNDSMFVLADDCVQIDDAVGLLGFTRHPGEFLGRFPFKLCREVDRFLRRVRRTETRAHRAIERPRELPLRDETHVLRDVRFALGRRRSFEGAGGRDAPETSFVSRYN